MAQPLWVLSYEGENITNSIAHLVTQVSYTDHVHGKSDEIELTVEDTDRRWRNLWYPSEGDKIDLKIGYHGQPLLNCGEFEIDEIELNHSPRTAVIRGLAVPVSTPLRTRASVAYDDTTLRQVVEGFAQANDLTLVGEVEDLPFRRITQAGETHLGFLKRLAESYGYAFSIRAGQLVFYALLDLESAEPVLTIANADILPGSTFKGSAQGTYVACELSYLDPESGEVITVRVEASGVRRGTGASGASATPPAAPLPTVVLRRNSPYREEVRDWQRFLQGRGQYAGTIDGIFGARAERGTRAFQSEQGIGVDGVVGPITYQAASDVGFLAQAEGAGGASAVGDVLRLSNVKVESAAEAEARARAELHRANRLRVSGTIKMQGDQRAVAGTTISVPDAGRLAGKYMVDQSVHAISRDAGYRTECEVSYVS